MATDYDAPRRRVEDELETDSLEGLKAAESQSPGIDDDGDIVEPFDLPAVDLSGEELNVTVVPKQCFLVQRRTRVAFTPDAGSEICQDCA